MSGCWRLSLELHLSTAVKLLNHNLLFDELQNMRGLLKLIDWILPIKPSTESLSQTNHIILEAT